MHRRTLDDDDDDGAAASAVSYMVAMLVRSSLGEETCAPPGLSYIPPDQSLGAVREEAELVIFSAVDALFARAAPRACSPCDIDLVVVCCSLCAPAPAFSEMVVSRYGMRSDVRSVNLSGMGCGAGLIAVDLAASLLRAMPRGARALVVSTEILSSNYYPGFRLRRAVRTNSAADDTAYRCVFQEEDGKGNLGTRSAFGDKLKANLAAFAPGVLPASELLLVALSAAAGRILCRQIGSMYRPNFRKVFQHFCVHATALAVVDTVQRGLGLSDGNVEASRMTLHRFGHTSSSSVMYELVYTEAKGRTRKGDRVWMISFGAGFECTSVAWECVDPASEADGSWADCIHRYPVRLVGRRHPNI
ncbi:hypothetical protein C2845_PM08G14220 [Panicum miliaceum]|uniref:very-long-chain 3-oxoacyl-CoA synthase n=1 Tax=Panicum miliaceum TaxID=4540 RepID=A0A3L6QXH4_PANMI|nr:hypothetical protein C2845_PM08G14220 [Panicum miliaceum]